MFPRIGVAACGGLVVFNAARIADVALMMLDLGRLVLSAVLHVA